jgi:hypothetical protein
MKADLDELLKLLEQEVQKKREDAKASSPSSLDSFERFLDQLKVTRGVDRIPNYVIYYTYKKVYKKSLGEKRLSKRAFFMRMTAMFDTARVGKQRYYILDKSSFDMTKEGKIKAKEFDKEYHRMVSIRTGKLKPRVLTRKRRTKAQMEADKSRNHEENQKG